MSQAIQDNFLGQTTRCGFLSNFRGRIRENFHGGELAAASRQVSRSGHTEQELAQRAREESAKAASKVTDGPNGQPAR
jgi:hypothetical protein